ncbi:MAG TPA: metal ABC transporter permease [Actinomycetales bacterium]|nr:metal ABC transporter permease [Actinomycetales bacterium]
MSWFLEPFQYEFFVRGLAAAVLAGALCGLLSTFITLRGMSYIGHGLSHSIFGGFAASAVAGVNVVLGAGVWGIATAFAIGWVSRRRSIGADAAIGVVTTASFALGVALLKKLGQQGGLSFDQALFGSVLGVRTSDLLLLSGALLVAITLVVLRYRQLLFLTFDPDVAQVSGVPVRRLDAAFLVVLSLSVLASLSVIGVTLVAAILVVPAVVARLVTSSFSRMLWLSTAVGAASGLVGMVASYQLDVPSGTTIVLTAALLFVVVLAVTGPGRLRRTAGMDAHADPVAAGGPATRRVTSAS